MAKSTFGETLKREREMRGVSLHEIATATRISTRFLEALENEQWDRLPGGVFNRGFVRAVAHFLGLDEEKLLAEYSAVTDDHPSVAVWADRPVTGPRNQWKSAVAALLLFAAAGAIGWTTWQNPEIFAAIQTAYSTPAPKPVRPAPSKSQPQPAPPAPMPAEAGAQSPAAAPDEPLDLKVYASRATTLTLLIDGRKAFEGRLARGEQQQYKAASRVEIYTGDSHALFVELNGLTVPPLGAPGAPGQITLTHDDLKKMRGQQN
jgi:cytoskeletal protein RodZ